jgi:hypothetical protein
MPDSTATREATCTLRGVNLERIDSIKAIFASVESPFAPASNAALREGNGEPGLGSAYKRND